MLSELNGGLSTVEICLVSRLRWEQSVAGQRKSRPVLPISPYIRPSSSSIQHSRFISSNHQHSLDFKAIFQLSNYPSSHLLLLPPTTFKMPNNYNITVKNKSGSLQQYALFNKVPIVSGKVQEQVWSNIFAVDKAANK